MVMSSAQIAQANASFQQQSMQNMQYSGMLSQHASRGVGAGAMAESFTGGAINTAAAWGAPMAVGAMMMGGVDPFSMGIRGALAGGARSGMMGAIGGGMAAAALPMTALMGAQYVGGQMMSGMAEQQQLRGQLGQGFGHMNAYGGRGFTRQESATIGSQFRTMTEQRGPGGEFATMDELGSLAANMGRMGMAQGVKNAKDFNDKFKEMMKTVTSIAKDFSTSLEEAQKVMSSMRGAGVFGNNAQTAMGHRMRGVATGAGVSMEEVSQIANIGSQISRSIGGRGISGAVAGTRAIGTVGGAVEAGVLSEEDVFNATGQTGAAGKQAMAANMLQRDATFLKGNKGRQLLAAIAKKDGSIDMEAVRKVQSGEVTVEQTIASRAGHLDTMSRANFVRNEGRLRGEALSAFGGQASSSAHLGWLKGKGYDPTSMDDKAMLAFQRHTGMDRDEADAEIKMLRNLDNITDKRRDNMREDRITTAVSNRNKTVGIEGVKRKLESAKQSVNNKLKEAGADILDSAEDRLESFINSVTGEYVRRVAEGTAEGVRLAREGGGGDRMKELTGTGGGAINRNLIEKVYGAKISNDGDDRGVASGDLKFTSEGARQRGLGGYLFGGKQTATSRALAAGGSVTTGGMSGGGAGASGAMLTASLTDFFGLGDNLSEAQKKAGAAFLEGKDTLAASRKILGTKSPEEARAAAKESMGLLKKMEEDGANKGSIAAQKQVSAVARIRAGEDKDKVMKETGLNADELKRTEDAMNASLETDRLIRINQAGGEMMKELAEEVKDFKGVKPAGKDHEGPVYDAQGKKLQGEAALEALKSGKGFTTASGAFQGELKGLSDEYGKLQGALGKSTNEDEKQRLRADMGEITEKTTAAYGKRRGELEGKSAEELQALIDSGAPEADMARRELGQDKVLDKARKSTAKGATLSALAQLGGGELSKEDAAALFGKKGNELMKGYADATGMDMSKMTGESKKKLQEVLEDAAAGKDVDKKLTGVEAEMREGHRAGLAKAQDSAASADDPQYRKLESIDGSLSDLLAVAKMANNLSAEQLATLKTGSQEGATPT